MNKNLSLLLSGIVSLPVIKSIAGSRSLTYDFSMLEERQFNDRRIARYKKKFPRVRVISKYCPDFDLYVFYLPNHWADPGASDDWNESFMKYSLGSDNPDESEVEIFNTAKQILISKPESKILFLGEQEASHQITPYMMLHTLAEAAIASDNGFCSHRPRTAIEEQTKNILNIDHCEKYFSKKEMNIPNEEILMKHRGNFYNCIFPDNNNIKRWLREYRRQKEQGKPDYILRKNPIFQFGYGLSPNSMIYDHPIFEGKGEPSQLRADCVADLLSKGEIKWLTPENCDDLKFLLENNYPNHTLPTDYEPLKCRILNQVFDILMIIKGCRVFIA